ncbi:MAG: alfa-L-rhamnosidase, partial [Planctomycetes bacterium]|nr:alfa-L-rhamnosidase [Planctomycetota bacterium]
MRAQLTLFSSLLILPLLGADLAITDLTCEHRSNPTGLQAEVPRLSWLFRTEGKGKSQQAYRILAASSEATLARKEGDLWDTGKTRSTSNYLIFYKGEKPLQSGQRVFWKVQTWDEKDVASPWSETAHFTMGLLGAGNWKAKWIAFKDEQPLHRNPLQLHLPPPRYYRKIFEAEKKIVRAQVHASALGIFELQL